MTTVLVHLASGIGNIVLATPLLMALDELGMTVDVWLTADYHETGDLLTDWAVVREVVCRPDFDAYDVLVPAAPPFCWHAHAAAYARRGRALGRPPDSLFYDNEQEYYVTFARRLGFSGAAPPIRLPISSSERFDIGLHTVVLAPGCKSGEMAAKRWPWFVELSDRFDDVAVVGTADDLTAFGGGTLRFPPHVRSYVGALRLRDTAALIATAGVVVANDSGLAHVAAAVGTPTCILFGPTPHRALGALPRHVTVLRAGLPCEPCWFTSARFSACTRRVDCLAALDVATVAALVKRTLGAAAHGSAA